jgi:hypothetical protein
LGACLDHELVDIDVFGPRDGERDALGDLVGSERLDVRVDLFRALGVAAKADA